MNEKANEVLAQLMERALNGVDAAVDFSQQQIPVVIEQLLMWHFITSLLWWIPAFITLGLWGIITKQGFKKGGWVRRFGDEIDPDGLGGWCLITVLCLFVFVMCADLDWLKIWLAPKLYLLEYGASLIK